MVKIYCKKINRDDFDKHISTKDHDELDDLPRKSVGQQVEAFLIAGQNLEMSRRELFELDGFDDSKDIDEFDTGLDEFSDYHDFFQAQQELKEKYANLSNIRREHAFRKKQEEQLKKQQEQNVDKKESLD